MLPCHWHIYPAELVYSVQILNRKKNQLYFTDIILLHVTTSSTLINFYIHVHAHINNVIRYLKLQNSDVCSFPRYE